MPTSPANATFHRAFASAEAVVLLLIPALALTLGKDSQGHCVSETQCTDDKGLLLDALCGCDLHLEGDLWGRGRVQVGTKRTRITALLLFPYWL